MTEIAAVGSSQGAGGAVRAATNDPALITTVLTFSLPNTFWVRPNPGCPTRAACMFDPAALTQPIFLISTHGPFDAVAASPATERSYFRSTKVHTALGIILYSDHKLADHFSIATNPGGMLGYATAWLEYQLRGDTTAAGAFIGPHPRTAVEHQLARQRHQVTPCAAALSLRRRHSGPLVAGRPAHPPDQPARLTCRGAGPERAGPAWPVSSPAPVRECRPMTSTSPTRR